MDKTNKVYIGTSLDGFIADTKGGIEFLDSIPFPEGIDMGYNDFMAGVDALVMGRVTFETVLGFDVDWPYQKPVYVLSSKGIDIPQDLVKKNVSLVSGTIPDVLEKIHSNGHHHLYIDGGKTIQSFLREDLIDEMIITTIPVLIGDGFPLFSSLDEHLLFECVSSTVFFDKVVQSRFVRKR